MQDFEMVGISKEQLQYRLKKSKVIPQLFSEEEPIQQSLNFAGNGEYRQRLFTRLIQITKPMIL
ncbi:hypothetical protein D3C71_2185370 [compost metagenome]